jgi:hypothetical protein
MAIEPKKSDADVEAESLSEVTRLKYEVLKEEVSSPEVALEIARALQYIFGTAEENSEEAN